MLFILNVFITMFIYVHDDKQEINNVLDNLHKYASEANGDEYIKLFNKNAVFHGTDLTERWTIEEFKEYALKRFESGTGWTYEAIERNIFVQVHYIPVHLHPYYQKMGFKKGDFPLAEAFYENCLSLPIFPSLTEEELKFTISTIKAFFNE